MNSPADDPSTAPWLKLSALCDGEATPGEVNEVARHWVDDAALRARWHTYQAIGDALRSDDLASDAEHDQSFLAAFRARLEAEPVVLAPARLAPPQAEPAALTHAAVAGTGGLRRQRWAAPAAMAAGVVAVAGALVVIQNTSSTAPAIAGIAPDNGPAMTVAASGASTGIGGAEMLRSPELDRYLAAHRQFAQGAALTTPSGVRQVAATPEGR